MKNNQKKNKNTYGILGLGRFGYALAMELAAAGADLLVLDRDEEKVRELREYTENAYVVRNLDKKTLADCGVADCDVAVVCIGSQMDTSILTTLHLVSLGVPHVIAKAASAEQGEILEKLGAEVVYPERGGKQRDVRQPACEIRGQHHCDRNRRQTPGVGRSELPVPKRRHSVCCRR